MRRQGFMMLIAAALLAGALAWWLLRLGQTGNRSDQSGNTAQRPTIGAQDEVPNDSPAELQQSNGSGRTAEEQFAQLRQRMVDRQLRTRDISDSKVLEVMERVPRHRFVPMDLQESAYEDRPLPIGHDQTISQPYIVALMTQCVQPKSKARALDIGTGSGYQAAVLAELVEQVYSIEIVEPLAKEAEERLRSLGYKNIEVRSGDGYRGWPEHAPFDVIVVAAAPDHIPQPLIEQLAPGGRMVIPVGDSYQDLLVLEKREDGTVQQRNVAPVRFVPMTGEAQREP